MAGALCGGARLHSSYGSSEAGGKLTRISAPPYSKKKKKTLCTHKAPDNGRPHDRIAATWSTERVLLSPASWRVRACRRHTTRTRARINDAPAGVLARVRV